MSRTDLDRDSMWRPSDAVEPGMLEQLVRCSEVVQDCYRAAVDGGHTELAADLRALGVHVASLLARHARRDLGVTERAS